MLQSKTLMSSIIDHAEKTCPHCQAALVMERLRADELLMCSRCRTQFPADFEPLSVRRVSRKAVWSLLLGLLSIIGAFFSGIPAVVLGLLALRDIRRANHALKGRWPALLGIVSGLLFGMIGCCVAIPLMVLLLAGLSTTEVDTPEEVVPIAASINEWNLPPRIEPVRGVTMMFGLRGVVYADRKDPDQAATTILLMQFPPATQLNRSSLVIRAEATLHYNRWLEVEETQEVEFKVHHDKVPFTVESGREEESGVKLRRYTALLARDKAPVLLMIVTELPNGSTDDGKIRLSEQQVRDFVASIRLKP